MAQCCLHQGQQSGDIHLRIVAWIGDRFANIDLRRVVVDQIETAHAGKELRHGITR